MINWDLFEPRNLVVVAGFSLLAIGIYQHFSAAIGQKKGS